MKRHHYHALVWAGTSLAVGVAVHSIILFTLLLFVAHIPPGVAWATALNEYNKGSAFLLALRLIPFGALAFVCLAIRNLQPRRMACMAAGGLAGTLGVTIPLYTSFWLPYHQPGATPDPNASIALLFFPFYCLAGMGMGLLPGWVASRIFLRPPKLPATGPWADQ